MGDPFRVDFSVALAYRGYERSEHPRIEATAKSTLKGYG